MHIIQSKKSGFDYDQLVKSLRSEIKAIVAFNGQFALGHQPPGQWYIQHKITGEYRIVHNLNRTDYGVSVSKVDPNEALTIETYELEPHAFRVSIKKDGVLVDRPFMFTVNIYA